MNKFLGYKVVKGKFKTESGEEIEFHNFLIRGVTDENLKPDEVGYIPFETKVKASDLASIFNTIPDSVGAVLNGLLGSNIEFMISIVSGKPAVDGFKVVSEASDNVFAELSKTDDKPTIVEDNSSAAKKGGK